MALLKKSKRNNNMKNRMNVLSLFSGGGFLDIGFINQGFQIEESIEIEPYFVKAYNYALEKYFELSNNHFTKTKQVKFKKIEKVIDASDYQEQNRIISEHRDNITGIIGGPPCQDFSVGGKQAGINGKRGKLINTYYDIVKKVKPSFFFFENVSGLIRTNIHKKGFDDFVAKLEDIGYVIWYDVLNTLDYGFPQDRRRLVLVGFKNDIVTKLTKNGYILEFNNKILKNTDDNLYLFRWPKIKYENPKSYDWPKKWKFNSKTDHNSELGLVKELSELFVETAFKDINDFTPNQKDCFNPRSEKFNKIDEGDTNRKSFKRLHRFRFSPTVAYGNNEVHLHPTLARRLTVREGLRLQTVPDEYILPQDMPLTYKFKIISNGVPTKKAELIAKEIKRTLNNYYLLL